MVSAATLSENKRTARRFPEEVATEGNIDLIEEICTDDVVDHSPLGEMNGVDELKKQMTYLQSAFSDFSATVEDVVAEGDMVAMRVTLRGTHDGEFQGIEPTGQTFEIDNMVFTRMEDGKIAERWVQPDTYGLLAEIGEIESYFD